MVVWITGLPGSGKSTIAKKVFRLSRSKSKVFLDGDQLREILSFESDYGNGSRKILAHRYAKLAKCLADQGHLVVVATVSMFHSVRNWNRKNNKKYLEVFLNVPIDVLIRRDQKKLYSRAIRGLQKDVQGINAKYEVPRNPHLEFANTEPKDQKIIVKEILNKVGKKLKS